MQPGLNTDPHGVNSFPSPSLTASLTSKHGFNIKGRVRDHTSTSSCPRLQTATPWSSQTGELHQLYDSERCVSTGAQNEKEKFIFWFIFVNHCWHWMCEAEVEETGRDGVLHRADCKSGRPRERGNQGGDVSAHISPGKMDLIWNIFVVLCELLLNATVNWTFFFSKKPSILLHHRVSGSIPSGE